MKRIFSIVSLLAAVTFSAGAQVPAGALVQIMKAEDGRNYDATLERLIGMGNASVRKRAALAAGRIGDEAALPVLSSVLAGDGPEDLRAMAAFAIGEIESVKGADAILRALKDASTPNAARARAVEAAGKIAAANAGAANAPAEAKNPKVVDLGEAILDTLEAEEAKRERRDRETVLLGLTAALRARGADGSDTVVALFLTNLDPRIRADAANTMARLRAKNANLALRGMLMSDEEPVARANAARALGAAEDKEAINMLIDAATEDEDARVRVSAIRSLAALRDPYAVERLLVHGEKLLSAYGPTTGKGSPKSRSSGRRAASIRVSTPAAAGTRVSTGSGSDRVARQTRPPANPPEKSELQEIASALGRLIPKTNDARTVRFLTALGEADRYRSPETEIAFARVAPKKYTEYLIAKKTAFKNEPQAVDAALQGIREFATLGNSDEESGLKRDAVEQLRRGLARFGAGGPSPTAMSVPELLRSLAAFKPDGYDRDLRDSLKYDDPIIRATAAELIGELPVSPANVDALRVAFERALLIDKKYNDAQLAILDAIFKLDKRRGVPTLVLAAGSPDHLVRKKALEIFKDATVLDTLRPDEKRRLAQAMVSPIQPYDMKGGTKLGQVLNTDTDYRRAAARKNGSVRAVLATQKGTFTIDLLPEDAPLTVDNFIKLARSNYFNGLEVHRVVPNFVMQDGDPRGDGNGGPGWTIRCEVNMVPYDQGAVGMALSGKDTGGSQWFVIHSPQPHLDGGYTVFGRVNETGMKVVDKIVQRDKILNVRIVGR